MARLCVKRLCVKHQDENVYFAVKVRMVHMCDSDWFERHPEEHCENCNIFCFATKQRQLYTCPSITKEMMCMECIEKRVPCKYCKYCVAGDDDCRLLLGKFNTPLNG